MQHEFNGCLVVLAGAENSGRIDVYQRFTAHEATRKFVEDAINEKLGRTAAAESREEPRDESADTRLREALKQLRSTAKDAHCDWSEIMGIRLERLAGEIEQAVGQPGESPT